MKQTFTFERATTEEGTAYIVNLVVLVFKQRSLSLLHSIMPFLVMLYIYFSLSFYCALNGTGCNTRRLEGVPFAGFGF